MSKEYHQDLKLIITFLNKAHSGIDMNLISYRRLTHIYCGDSCPFGLGGYSDNGFAWQFKLPSHICFRGKYNLLEFIESIINPWVDFITERLKRGIVHYP